MKRVVIVGGGFSGLSALKRLSAHRGRVAITLVDRKRTFDFLPALPDIIGGRISPGFLTYPLDTLCRGRQVEFVNREVKAIDIENQVIDTGTGKVGYDYSILAAGSQTNFYGDKDLEKYAYALDTLEDAKRILCQLDEDRYERFVIGGGGYTGIEIATNIRRFLAKNRIKKTIVIVERAPSILGALPAWMKEYVSSNLARLDIEVLADTAITGIYEDEVRLSSGRSFKKAMLVWAAGVKTGDCIFDLKVEKDRQGRIKVDEYLRLDKYCFAAGDTAQFLYQKDPLRMSVQYAITEGIHAADNLVRSIDSRPLRRYIPYDLGYIVPMANNASCGLALGVPVKGLISSGLHYFFCVYRSYGLRNKIGIIKSLLRGK